MTAWPRRKLNVLHSGFIVGRVDGGYVIGSRNMVCPGETREPRTVVSAVGSISPIIVYYIFQHLRENSTDDQIYMFFGFVFLLYFVVFLYDVLV